MKVNEKYNDENDVYSGELQEQVEEVFQYVSEITEIKSLLNKIRLGATDLRKLFWNEEEIEKREKVVSFFEARMQATVYYTLKNLENYKQDSWKQLVKGEEFNE